MTDVGSKLIKTDVYFVKSNIDIVIISWNTYGSGTQLLKRHNRVIPGRQRTKMGASLLQRYNTKSILKTMTFFSSTYAT